MEIDPEEEVLYRFRLAEEHLETAAMRFRAGDWAGVVQSSQLAAKNAAKAVISHFHIPSWTHDPSRELREILEELPEDLRSSAERLAEISETLAPKHGRTSYGVPDKRLTPKQLYDMGRAGKSLKAARKSLEISRNILKGLGYSISF